MTYSFSNHTYYAPKKEAQKILSHHVVSPKMLEYFAAIAQTLLRFSIKFVLLFSLVLLFVLTLNLFVSNMKK